MLKFVFFVYLPHSLLADTSKKLQVVDSTIMLNPSHLTKANGAGTFARLSVYPMERGELERRVDESLTKGLPELHTEDNIEHRVWERCRVDIVKI